MRLRHSDTICLFILITSSLLLQGCEAFIYAKGNIYDAGTHQPIKGASVKLIWRGRDTMEKCAYLLDTMDYDARRRIRRTGVKDDYFAFDFGTSKRAKPIPLYTDSNGYFQTGTYWTSAAFGVPKVKILVTQNGYKPLVADRYPMKNFYLEREPKQ